MSALPAALSVTLHILAATAILTARRIRRQLRPATTHP
jgi:hypothetical protein